MNKKRLCELLETPDAPLPDVEYTGVTEDSRRVQPGFIFVAVSGGRHDGHEYIPQAQAQGAVAVVGDKSPAAAAASLPYLRLPQPRKAAGILAHAFAGEPTAHMQVIGITGTNGKGSTAFLVHAILTRAGLRAANFGTLGYQFPSGVQEASHTTPFGEDLAALFARAREERCSHVVMEVSSIALDQERVAGIHFHAAAFTNLTQDHLDYHKDMESYLGAKLKLFERVHGAGACTVVNVGDDAADVFIAASQVPCVTFGKGGDVKAQKLEHEFTGTAFELKTPWGKADAQIRLLGKHNVQNALCAVALCGGLGIELDKIVDGLQALDRVPGRFEAVDAGQNFFVIVDYAHTEDGLLNVLKAARKLCDKRLIVVFGCGGDRDKTKRPKMGAVAGELGDFCIVTSDNPRTEDPHRILLDVELGVQRAGAKKGDDYLVIENREEAIHRAIAMARKGDLVMIAGKGHEDYQILGTTKIHFDDREVALAALKKK